MQLFKNTKALLLLVCLFLSPLFSLGQLTVSPGHTAAYLSSKLAGQGVTIVRDSIICDNRANGSFVSVATPIGFDSGIILSTGLATDAAGSEGSLTSTFLRTPGDRDFRSLIGGTTIDTDACALIIYFVPKGDTVKFRYQFGSEEYRQSNCGVYNDAFAFFISGPGVSTSLPGVNMATVPGTNIPVAVNSINSGIVGTASGANIANCTSMGTGSPFTSYYLNNAGGSSVAYRGYTQVLTAQHAVTPCDTYRIKMAIVDAGNGIYDSGVFIEAGSLSTNTFHFSRVDTVGTTIAGVSHTIVRGCSPTRIHVLGDRPTSATQVLHYVTSGTAVSGVDYTPLSDSVTIAAGSDSVSFDVQALVAASGGSKTLVLHLLSPTGCGYIDTLLINIIDAPSLAITTPDTTFCLGGVVPIVATGSVGLTYSWSPAAGLSDAFIASPTATPTATVTYVLTGALPGTTCAAVKDSITLTELSVSISMITRDTTVCAGITFRFLVNGSDSNTYLWSPATYLDNPTAKEPLVTPLTNTVYTLNAVAPNGCTASASVTINVAAIPAGIFNGDTAICKGKYVQVLGYGPRTGITYQWIPTAGIAVSDVLNAFITPDTSATYYLIGSVTGCTSVIDSMHIDLQPNPIVFAGGNRSVCQFDTLHLRASVLPLWYSGYSFSWTPATYLDHSNTQSVVFTAGATQKYYINVTTSAGCAGIDSTIINVNPGNFLSPLTDAALCPHDSIQFSSAETPGGSYHWMPGIYLSDSTAANPWIKPISSIVYTVVGTSAMGCKDTINVNITVWPLALVSLDDSFTLYPGESIVLNPQTNASSFQWFPPAGLSAVDVSNPTATPEISTMYHLTVTTDHGCVATDSTTLIVNAESLLAVPNAFVASSEGNTFRAELRGEASLNYFRVYNRWGNLMFETKNINQGWDGAYKGKSQPVDVYVYEIQAVTLTGQVFTRHGNVTLLR